MLTHPKSTMRVLCTPAYWSSGHVTAAKGISTPRLFLQSDLWRRAASRWVLPHISSIREVYHYLHHKQNTDLGLSYCDTSQGFAVASIIGYYQVSAINIHWAFSSVIK